LAAACRLRCAVVAFNSALTRCGVAGSRVTPPGKPIIVDRRGDDHADPVDAALADALASKLIRQKIFEEMGGAPMPVSCRTMRTRCDPGVCAGCHSARAEWLLGYPEKALASAAESLALAERIAHPFTLGVALCSCSVVYLNRREPERALRQLDAAEVLAAEQRLSLIYETGILRGAALLGQGAVDEAIARIREGVTNWTRLGRTSLLAYGLAFLAEGLARHGDRAAALAALREGLETARATGEHMWDAELHRLTGTVLVAENKLDEGQTSLQQAIHIARAQQAKSLELRAAHDLARFWGEQGRRAKARDLLASVYGWFTEGFDTADLKEAKALLDQLA
jgi:predicted ATPase